MNDISKTIGYADWSWNLITGCLNGCEYCYAKIIANGRVKPLYLGNENYATTVDFRNGEYKPNVNAFTDPFYPRFWINRLEEPMKLKKPSRIFPCDMSDWCGIGIPEKWVEQLLEVIQICQQHKFLLLTKQPQNLPRWSPFPENCEVGVSATSAQMTNNAVILLHDIKASVKFLSIEPLLSWQPLFPISFPPHLNWIILGSCTGSHKDLLELQHKYPDLTLMQWDRKWTLQPKIEWVQDIVEAADKASIPVWLKGNLDPLLPKYNPSEKLRQELPR